MTHAIGTAHELVVMVYSHCMLCCEGQLKDCSCKKLVDWGTPVWYDDDDTLQLWLQYFQCVGYTIRDDDKHS